jgi:hypothetical protein
MAASHSISCSFAIFIENGDLATMGVCAPHQRTILITYFVYNAQNANGRNVVYIDFCANHVWKIREKVWLA